MAVPHAARTVLYRYGPLAWFWRLLMLLGAALGAGSAVAAAMGAGWLLWLAAAAFALPTLFFGYVVATRVELEAAQLRVRTLLGIPRTIGLSSLGGRKFSSHATTDVATRIHAPRLWQFVRGSLPIYLDLLATIPDPHGFARVFGAHR
jgi:hypothetical protein